MAGENTVELASLRFDGKRFENHALDVECTQELIAYHTLVLECAKELWRGDEVGPEPTLPVCCGAFRGDANCYPNLTVKKIPKIVLQKREWGHDDDSLNVENLPQAPKPAKLSASQGDLFHRGEG
ncbi:MAG: hypothetical protein ACKVQU_07890 [Burkholderiales bacterium]